MAIKLEPLPPRDAINALIARGRVLHPTFAWQDIYADLHASMFTVAKSVGHDVLEDIFNALLKALEDGQTFRDFAANLKPVLVQKGWWGRAVAVDPETGDLQDVQLGSMRRLRLIFDVNMRVSYAVGRWSSFERTKRSRPFLRYVAILDDVTRPDHEELHNLVLPVDDPFWDIFAPPNGWNCRCTLQNLSQRDIDRLIKQGVPLRFEAPAIERRPWTNRRTGEMRLVPVGVDPGWDYNPGKAGHQATVDYLSGRNDGRIA